MRKWFVTTGTSILDGSRCWGTLDDPTLEEWLKNVDHKSHGELQDDAQNWANLLALHAKRREILAPGSRTPEELEKWSQTVIARHFRLACWERSLVRPLPAELATLNIAFRVAAFAPNYDDHFYFIAGQSRPETAYLLAEALRKCLTAPRSAARVHVIGPFALDPLNNESYSRGIQALWEQVERPGLADAVFVLTGGYKAVLIDLVWRLARRLGSPPILYSHEEGEVVIEIRVEDRSGETPRVTVTPHQV